MKIDDILIILNDIFKISFIAYTFLTMINVNLYIREERKKEGE